MEQEARRKKEILTIEDGGCRTIAIPRRRRGTPDAFATADFRLDREMVAVFAAIHGADGNVPSKGLYNIRSLDHRPWRTLAKRLREAIAAGAPREDVERPIKVFAEWIAEQYESDGRKGAA